MSFLYLTADKIGTETGGGAVTYHESEAFKTLGSPCTVWDREFLNRPVPLHSEPWGWDHAALNLLIERGQKYAYPKLAHFYSGSFPHTAFDLKLNNTKICWTIAAHDKDISRLEHEKLGWGFPYPHLIEPGLWSRYIDGYRHADVIICPGSVPAQTVRNYGPEFVNKRIEIIPHGCHLPEAVAPYPKHFTVGYMGAIGADKGVAYLLQAWKKLNYKDATLLLAGPSWYTEGGRWLLEKFGGGKIEVLGWVDKVANFYNRLSFYVQPSATEGFGLEVLEALSYGRAVLCSNAAGAVDLISPHFRFPSCDTDALAATIDLKKQTFKRECFYHDVWQQHAANYTWEKIRARYTQVWQSLLQGEDS